MSRFERLLVAGLCAVILFFSIMAAVNASFVMLLPAVPPWLALMMILGIRAAEKKRRGESDAEHA